MKRIISVLILSVMLLQPLLAVPGIWVSNDDVRTGSILSCDTQPSGSATDRDTRGPITENDDIGGSWFDDFDDDSGIGGGLGGRLEADEHTVGLWHFDEGTGNEARDASENGNDGTLMNMEEEDWVDGKYGKALKFDGEDDYVASSFAFNPGSNSHTIEFWMKAPLLTESKAVVTGRTDHTFVIWAVEDTGKIMVHYGNDGSSWNIANAVGNRIGDSVIADNNWHHIVMVRDGNNVNNQPLKELAFYL